MCCELDWYIDLLRDCVPNNLNRCIDLKEYCCGAFLRGEHCAACARGCCGDLECGVPCCRHGPSLCNPSDVEDLARVVSFPRILICCASFGEFLLKVPAMLYTVVVFLFIYYAYVKWLVVRDAVSDFRDVGFTVTQSLRNHTLEGFAFSNVSVGSLGR